MTSTEHTTLLQAQIELQRNQDLNRRGYILKLRSDCYEVRTWE